MKEADIKLLISQIWRGFERADNPPQSFPNEQAQAAHKAEDDRIEALAESAAFDLIASTLCAIHRIADAQERIADTLEAGGPFALMEAAKPLFGGQAELSDASAAERG